MTDRIDETSNADLKSGIQSIFCRLRRVEKNGLAEYTLSESGFHERKGTFVCPFNVIFNESVLPPFDSARSIRAQL